MLALRTMKLKVPVPPLPPTPNMRMRLFELVRARRRESTWEVVDHKVVQPVPTFYDDEDIDILRLSSTETRGTYVFDLHSLHKRAGKKAKRMSIARDDANAKCDAGRKALIFARQQLLDEVSKKDCNVLLLEGWSLTILRKGKHCRIEVQYNGRGALADGKPDLGHRLPPFLELLGEAQV